MQNWGKSEIKNFLGEIWWSPFIMSMPVPWLWSWTSGTEVIIIGGNLMKSTQEFFVFVPMTPRESLITSKIKSKIMTLERMSINYPLTFTKISLKYISISTNRWCNEALQLFYK